jgi:hypothetical protein
MIRFPQRLVVNMPGTRQKLVSRKRVKLNFLLFVLKKQ